MRGTPAVSVVIASYGRADRLARLLDDLAAQTLDATQFEVLVVDDGAPTPLADALGAWAHARVTLTLIRQENGGPAAARNRGARDARGALLVFVDDDMRVGPAFLEAHRDAHAGAVADAPMVVLGALRAPTERRLPLVERYRLFQLARTAVQAGRALSGGDVYSGNLSVPRALFEQVGGFDVARRLSEDAEFGMRCVAAGARVVASGDAWSVHDTEDPGLGAWVRRSIAYGGADLSVSAQHPDDPAASPWRFLAAVHAVSRPLLLASAFLPWLGRLLGRAVLLVAAGVAALGLEGIAMRLVTVSYGLLYFSGLAAGAGSGAALRASMRRYLVRVEADALPPSGRAAKCLADIVADHDALAASDARYRAGIGRGRLLVDAVQRIGLQIMVAYRLMRWCRAMRLGVVAKLLSRLMRHLYGSDIHWDATFAPGVVIVHGMGLCISHGARVGTGCILFQHVTLGESIHPTTREIGSPTLESNVHVAPGAVLLGPIVVGAGSKIAPNVVLTESVPPNSLVEGAGVSVTSRDRRRSA